MSNMNLNTKLAIGSDESTSAANRASRINSLVSRMFARANGGGNGDGLATQIKASSTHALLKEDGGSSSNVMVQTKLVNAASIRSSSHSTAHQPGLVKPTKSGKGKKATAAAAATFKPDATQSTLKSCAKDGLSLKSASLRMTTEQPVSDAVPNVPRRNLFGIRLNHDQLKQDLKDMWRDQIEQQKQRWNFDFETLRPTTTTAASTAHKGLIAASSTASSSSTDQSERFKWTRVTYYTPGLPASSSMAPSGFDRAELFNNSQGDYEEEYESDTEQEEDDALAMPQFYKYQRRLKFNDEPSRIKMMTITVSQAPTRKSPTIPVTTTTTTEVEAKKSELSAESTLETKANPMTFEPIFKMALKNSQPSTVVVEKKAAETSKKSTTNKTTTTTIRRPKAIKRPQPQANSSQQPSLALSPSTQNLIITFSENRKDTLRSASSNHGNAPAPAPATALTLTNTKVKLTAREGETAFVSAVKAVQPTTETLKQQSLLGNYLSSLYLRLLIDQTVC